jgi:hypothetical protein
MSPHRHLFKNFTYLNRHPIRTATNQLSYAEGKGDIDISLPNGDTTTKLTLRDALYAPELGQTLVSVRRATGAGFKFIFGENQCEILEPKGTHIGSIRLLPESQLWHITSPAAQSNQSALSTHHSSTPYPVPPPVPTTSTQKFVNIQLEDDEDENEEDTHRVRSSTPFIVTALAHMATQFALPKTEKKPVDKRISHPPEPTADPPEIFQSEPERASTPSTGKPITSLPSTLTDPQKPKTELKPSTVRAPTPTFLKPTEQSQRRTSTASAGHPPKMSKREPKPSTKLKDLLAGRAMT